MLGQDLKNFIEENQLEFLETETDCGYCLIWEFFLSDERDRMIEYRWDFYGDHTITELRYSHVDGEWLETRNLTTKEAQELRGKRAIQQVNQVNIPVGEGHYIKGMKGDTNGIHEA